MQMPSMTHASPSLLSLLLAALLCLSTLCVAPAAADPDPTLDAAAAQARLEAGASAPSLSALTNSLGQGYRVAFSVVGQPWRGAGVVERAFDLLPPAAKAKYAAFTAESGIDLIARFDGALFAADAADLNALDDAERLLLVVSLSGSLPPDLLAALDKLDQPDKQAKNKKVRHRQDAALLTSLDPDQRAATAAALLAQAQRRDSDARAVDIGPNAHLLIRSEKAKSAHGYAYIWSEGVLIGTVPNLATLDEAALKLAAAQALHRLHAAATAITPTDPIPAMSFHTPIPNGSVDGTLHLDSAFALTCHVRMEGPLLDASKQFLVGVAVIKADPLAFLDKMNIPPSLHPLASLLIHSTEAAMSSPDTLTITTRTPTTTLLSKVDALTKALPR
jgi:hypothetical protein